MATSVNTAPLLANDEKHDPEALGSGYVCYFLYGIQVPYNLPHMLVYTYRNEFLLIARQAVRPLIMAFTGRGIIYGKDDN
mgnify:CR=1 FL=1